MKFLLFTALLVSSIPAFTNNSHKINAIPYELSWQNREGNIEIADSFFTISAIPGAELFESHDGRYSHRSLPLLLFKPDSNFVLQAKVKTDMPGIWDAGVLAIYVNENYWTKFCFERKVNEQPAMVSVVNNIMSDDANSDEVDGCEVYMRVVKFGKSFRLSFSIDGISWSVVRYFFLNETEGLRVGFASQSPHGKSCITTFSQVLYSNNEIEEYFNNRK